MRMITTGTALTAGCAFVVQHPLPQSLQSLQQSLQPSLQQSFGQQSFPQEVQLPEAAAQSFNLIR
jgi:hypothetical protein